MCQHNLCDKSQESVWNIGHVIYCRTFTCIYLWFISTWNGSAGGVERVKLILMINRSFCFSSPIKFQVMHCDGGSGLWKEDVDWLPHLFVAGVVGAAIWQQEKELCLHVSFLCWNVGSIEEILCLINDTILARKAPSVTSGMFPPGMLCTGLSCCLHASNNYFKFLGDVKA